MVYTHNNCHNYNNCFYEATGALNNYPSGGVCAGNCKPFLRQCPWNMYMHYNTTCHKPYNHCCPKPVIASCNKCGKGTVSKDVTPSKCNAEAV